MTNNNNYRDEDIKILTGLDPVKKRPGMYIGGTDVNGLHHLIWEILDNSVDENVAGYCNHISITILKDYSIIINDNGRGIPTGIHPETKKSTIETIFTTLHSGGKFEKNVYKVSGGLHGVGASVVNALSEELEVWVEDKKNKYYQKFVNGGNPKEPLKIISQSRLSGTTVRFLPDFKIFKNVTYDFDKIKLKIKELAFLNKTLYLSYKNEITGENKKYHYDNGILSFLDEKIKNKTRIINKNIYFHGKNSNIEIECAFTYISDSITDIYSFCNNISTVSGGSHLEGFKTTLTRIINKYGIKNSLIPKTIQILGEDCRDGLVCILSIKHPDPQFEGQTKSRLGNIDAKTAVSKVSYFELEKIFDSDPAVVKNIISFVVNSARARIAAKLTRQTIKNKITNPNIILPGKLTDCSSNNFYERELFLVEGDSAGGSAKLARNRNFQAILPLRGKVINSQKEPSYRVLKNSEINSLIQAIGVKYVENTKQESNLDGLRYDRIIIMTDADVDGSHISILLLTFFINYFPELIKNGNIYLAKPPLYKLILKNSSKYLYSDEELEDELKTTTASNYSIQRYKGLGEMNPDQLWDTTMDPEKRFIQKIVLSDLNEMKKVFEDLMGATGILKRKEFIMENAKNVSELDI